MSTISQDLPFLVESTSTSSIYQNRDIFTEQPEYNRTGKICQNSKKMVEQQKNGRTAKKW